jgi:hypothetical protein
MEDCFAFAVARADAAPGTAAELLPLFCAVEALVERVEPEHRGVADAARTRAQSWLEGPGSTHSQAATGHSMLIRYCWARGRDLDAYAHLRALGSRIPAYPWEYAEQPLDLFLRVRTEVLDTLSSAG